MNTNLTQIENKLWSAADELRANSSLKGSEYSTPVLGPVSYTHLTLPTILRV